jgi:hypothetical protein|tara:strand:- start:316 stop:1428 length:1113 start_codon:yes stop_codon:yes gene_type:complete
MSNFSLQVPINGTSLGQVSTNLLYELFSRKLEPNIFPIAGVDLSSYEDIVPEQFVAWLQLCTQKSLKDFKRTEPSLRIWHINGSQDSISKNPFLYFFHELDQLTATEKNILNSYDKVASPCSFTEEVCKEYGVDNHKTINLGYNSLAFKETEVKKYENNEIVIALAGKFEKRKHTASIINLLKNKFGNDKRFKIHLHIFNPFFHQDPNKSMEINKMKVVEACDGDVPHNMIFMPYFRKLTELNQAYNIADIVVDGSGGESWSLPSFHMAGLGKQCVVNFNSGIKEWATDSNSIKVAPNGKISAIDNLFFQQGSPFNCGNIYDLDIENMSTSLDSAVKNVLDGKINEGGKKLPSQFTDAKFCDEILELIKI